MGYFYWEGIPRKADDPTRIAAFVAAELAKQDELSELGDVNVPAPADGEVLTYDTGTSKWISAAGDGNGDLGWQRYWRIGRNHWSMLCKGNMGDARQPGLNVLAATAYPMTIGMTFDRISIYTHTGLAGSARLGIYDDDGNSYPNDLVLDAGIVDVTGVSFKQIVINQVLSAGLYWLVLLLEVDIFMKCDPEVTKASILGFDDYNVVRGSWTVAQAWGVLPATYPGGGALNDRHWNISLRRSA